MEEQKYIKLDNGAYLRVSIDGNGNYRRYIDFKTQHAKQYAAYILMNKDLDLSIKALSALNFKKDNEIINQSLAFFFIITYSKCFTSNNGRGASLNFKEVFKSCSEELIEEHKRILNLRNDYVAHAGSSFEKCGVTGTIFMEIGGMQLEGNIAYVSNIGNSVATCIKLCDYVKVHVKNKIDVFQKKIFENFQSLEYEETMSQSKLPNNNQLYIEEKLSENGFEYSTFKQFKI